MQNFMRMKDSVDPSLLDSHIPNLADSGRLVRLTFLALFRFQNAKYKIFIKCLHDVLNVVKK